MSGDGGGSEKGNHRIRFKNLNFLYQRFWDTIFAQPLVCSRAAQSTFHSRAVKRERKRERWNEQNCSVAFTIQVSKNLHWTYGLYQSVEYII